MTDVAPLSVHRPYGEPKGAIVVVQEAFGVNDHIEDVATRFAAEGWLAVAPHLFLRTGDAKLGYDDREAIMPHMMGLTREGVLADLDVAFDLIAEEGIEPSHRGIVGFCICLLYTSDAADEL